MSDEPDALRETGTPRAEEPGRQPDPARAEEPGRGPDAPRQAEIRERVIEVLQTIFDPEIPVNIYELGLVYGVDVDDAGAVSIRMTLTSPACPAAEMLPPLVESRTRAVPGVTDVRLEIVWDPPWNPGMMSEAAKVQLNML